MSTENTLFITAARKKIRFASTKGTLQVEDLFDLSLEALDKIAITIDTALDAAGKKSFIGKRKAATTDLDTALDVVKFVIDVKQSEDAARKEKAEKENQVQFLNGLLEKKKMAQLEGLSMEEIQKQLDQLK